MGDSTSGVARSEPPPLRESNDGALDAVALAARDDVRGDGGGGGARWGDGGGGARWGDDGGSARWGDGGGAALVLRKEAAEVSESRESRRDESVICSSSESVICSS